MPNDEVKYDDELQLNLAEYGHGEALGLGKTWIVFEKDLVRVRRRIREMERATENLSNRYNSLGSSSTEKYNDLVDKWNDLKNKYNELIDKYNDLNRNSVSKESAERLENEYRKNIADYNKLIGEYSGLQERFNDLSRRHNRLNEDNEELKEKIEEMRTRHEEETRERHREELRLSRNEERLRQEGVGLREQLTDTRQQLTYTRGERDNLLIRVDERSREIQTLTNQMADLRIESSNRNNQLQENRRDLIRVQEERDERITPFELQDLLNTLLQRDEEITSLRGELNQSQEIGTTERLRNKEQKLESFVHRLGIEWEQIQLLRGIYNELVHSRKRGDINGIRENQIAIETIKQNLLQSCVRLDDVQEICDKCEEIAQLSLQLEQQFEARIEVLVNHRNF